MMEHYAHDTTWAMSTAQLILNLVVSESEPVRAFGINFLFTRLSDLYIASLIQVIVILVAQISLLRGWSLQYASYLVDVPMTGEKLVNGTGNPRVTRAIH